MPMDWPNGGLGMLSGAMGGRPGGFAGILQGGGPSYPPATSGGPLPPPGPNPFAFLSDPSSYGMQPGPGLTTPPPLSPGMPGTAGMPGGALPWTAGGAIPFPTTNNTAGGWAPGYGGGRPAMPDPFKGVTFGTAANPNGPTTTPPKTPPKTTTGGGSGGGTNKPYTSSSNYAIRRN